MMVLDKNFNDIFFIEIKRRSVNSGFYLRKIIISKILPWLCSCDLVSCFVARAFSKVKQCSTQAAAQP